MQIDVVLFDGFDEVDAVGPFEVFANAGLDVAMVALDGPRTVRASHGLEVVAGAPRAAPEMVVVPGGGWSGGEAVGVRAEVQRGGVGAHVARLHAGGAIVASVCTGAMVLAHAGLLEGRPATTHAVAFDDLAAAGIEVRRGVAFVDDGDVLTSAGVVNGIELALYLVERLRGPEVARAVTREMELRQG